MSCKKGLTGGIFNRASSLSVVGAPYSTLQKSTPGAARESLLPKRLDVLVWYRYSSIMPVGSITKPSIDSVQHNNIIRNIITQLRNVTP